jgi:hypothetical protein
MNSMISVVPYEPARKADWNRFVADSKNGTFLFNRDYMEYHSDRFVDASLMFFDGEALAALLPATDDGDVTVSHGGLTFGGLITGLRMRTATMLALFDVMVAHLRDRGRSRLLYKRVPYIYHRFPSDEDLYALFRHNATLTRRDVSAAVLLGDRIPYTKGRKYGVSRSRKVALSVQRSLDFDAFMHLERSHLEERFGARPVHSAAEIAMLAERFPERIKLFTAALDGRLLAGIIVYESDLVAHAQYIATTEEGRDRCALDAVIDHLLNVYYREKRYFDFGTSNERAGRYLNAGLIDNKESYGARAVVHEFFELIIPS